MKFSFSDEHFILSSLKVALASEFFPRLNEIDFKIGKFADLL